MTTPEILHSQISEVDASIASVQAEGKDPASLLSARAMLEGQLALSSNDFMRARDAFQSSIVGFGRLGMHNEAVTVSILAGRACAERADLDQASEFSNSAIEAAEKLWWSVSLPDRARVPKALIEASDFAIDIAARRADYARLFDLMQVAKGRWLNDLTCLNQARRLVPLDAIIPSPKKWNDSLAQRRQAFSERAGALDEAWLKCIAGASDVEKLNAAESNLTAAYGDLASMSYGPLFSNASAYSLENVKSLLSPTEALLEVFVQTNAVYLLLITWDGVTPHKVEIGASDLGWRVLRTHLA